MVIIRNGINKRIFEKGIFGQYEIKRRIATLAKKIL